VGAQENLGKCRGQELVLGKELPVDSPLVQELPTEIERGQEVNLELLLVVEEVDAGQTNLHAGKDHRAVDDTEEAAVLEENDQKAREEEENVHLDAEGEAGGLSAASRMDMVAHLQTKEAAFQFSSINSTTLA
jgi:hypothetical protein